MKTVRFEKRSNEVSRVKATIEYIAKTAPTKQHAVDRLNDVMSGVKIGFGGSHVWCSDLSNNRLFIIEGF